MAAKILAFAGSTRTDSFNKKLVRITAQAARDAGADVTLVDLRDLPMPLYDGDLEAKEGIPPHAMGMKKLFLEHQGLLMSCPEYNSSVTGVWKNTIDWVSRTAPGEKPLQCFKDKVAALTSASPGWRGGLRGLVTARSILGNIGVLVVPHEMNLAHADEAFAADGSLKDSKQLASATNVATSLVTLLTKLHP